MITGAPIRTGEASPLRVATGGEASFGLESPRRRSPARANSRRGRRLGLAPGRSLSALSKGLQPSSPPTDVASNGQLSTHTALRSVQTDESLEKRLLKS